MTEATHSELVTIPEADALSIFTTDGAIEPFLTLIKDKVKAFASPGIATEADRTEIKSFAAKIAKSRKYLDDDVGKKLAAKQKEVPKLIDATRKHLRETLDALRDDVRKPVTEWELAEKARKQIHIDTLDSISKLSTSIDEPSEVLRANLKIVEAIGIGPGCEEFETEYTIAVERAKESLSAAIATAIKREAEQAELIALREAAVEREKADHDDAIRQEASVKAESDAKERELKLIKDKEDAEQRAVDTARKVREDIEAKAAANVEAAEKRAADVEHKGAVNRKALAAFVQASIPEDTAKAIITLIAKGAIPSITINY